MKVNWIECNNKLPDDLYGNYWLIKKTPEDTYVVLQYLYDGKPHDFCNTCGDSFYEPDEPAVITHYAKVKFPNPI